VPGFATDDSLSDHRLLKIDDCYGVVGSIPIVSIPHHRKHQFRRGVLVGMRRRLPSLLGRGSFVSVNQVLVRFWARFHRDV